MNRFKIILISLLFCFATIFGQIKIHKHLSTEDGLISNQIFSMYQDSKGYLWIGTNNGVSRWDGISFKNYTKQDGLASSFIFDIVEDKNGTIYFATYGGGISYLENDSVNIINTENGLPNDWINKFYIRENDEILIVGQYSLAKLIDGKVETILTLNDKPHGTIWTVYESLDKKLYIGTQKGLKIFNNDSLLVLNKKDGLVNDTIWAITEDINGVIYLGTNEGISKFHNGKFSALKNKNKKISSVVPSIYISNDNTIYYGTTNGVMIEKKDTLEFLTTENGLTQNDIWCITEDKNGTIYFGSKEYGIDLYFPDKMENKFLGNSKSSRNVISVFQDKLNNFYFGTDRGLYNNKNEKIKFSHKNLKINNSPITFINELQDGKITIGLEYSFGIISQNNFQEYSLNADQKNLNKIHSFYMVDKEKYLVGAEYGLFNFENGTFNRLKTKKSNSPALVSTFCKLTDSTVVLGTHGNGISYFDNDKFEYINTNNGLSNSTINSIFIDEDNVIYVGTDQGGLNIIKDKTVIDTINVDDGLLSNTILGIIKDDFNNFYITTPRGINILTFYADEPFIRKITKNDGLISNNLNKNSIIKDNNGNIWFGTTEGISKFNPSAVKPISKPPQIYFTKIKIFDEDFSIINFNQNNQLSYNQNYISFYYSGVDIPNTDKILYKYRLSGVNKDWLTTNETNANYTSLDDGNYIFEVKARNEWGYWSEPVNLSFTINPAWWETWWFYTLTFFAISSLIAFVASYKYRNLLAVEKLRTKISADLHDSIGSGLSEITILSGLLQANPNVSDLQNGLKNISVTARSLVGNMSDIVWLVNPVKDSLKDLLLRLQDSYQEVLAQANISFNINGIENIEEIHLPLTYRQHLFLLFKEAINNSLKYSECSKIELTIIVKGKNLSIHYQENGKGFDLKSKDEKGNGLTNMKNRAKAINGNCEIISEINKGTVIKFNGKV